VCPVHAALCVPVTTVPARLRKEALP
jgi:hypothetical protein